MSFTQKLIICRKWQSNIPFYHFTKNNSSYSQFEYSKSHCENFDHTHKPLISHRITSYRSFLTSRAEKLRLIRVRVKSSFPVTFCHPIDYKNEPWNDFCILVQGQYLKLLLKSSKKKCKNVPHFPHSTNNKKPFNTTERRTYLPRFSCTLGDLLSYTWF